jgi:hypothetical protein
MTQQTIESTTQKFLDIHDITDDVLILKDGSSALVITLNAMNFGLLAEPEQDAIMYAYAGLLNSLNYPIQVVIRSQTKDVTSYLNLLKDEQQKSTDSVKRGWIERYRAFVSDLIKERNVLDKKFYVVISATSLEMGMLPPSSVIPGTAKVDLSTVERSVILDKAKEILEPRRDHLLGQFGRIGLQGRQLTTQELIQLFYVSYNPEAAEGQQITDTQSYTTPLVQASVQGGTMDSSNPQTPNPTATTPMATPTPEATATATPTAPMTTENVAAAATPALTPDTPTPSIPTPVATTSPTPMATPATATTSPNPTPVAPAPSTPAMPTTTTQSASPIPSITTPTDPGTPMANASTATPVSKTGSDMVQNEIDSTLQQLGSMDGTTPAAATPTEATTSPNPTPDTPAPSTPAMPTATTQSASPTPMAAPAQTPPGAPATGDAKDGDSMPPLPEI